MTSPDPDETIKVSISKPAPNPKDVDTLARTIWAEARGESLTGMHAVGSVILNRTKDSRWPSTVHAVCTQPMQFSCWNDNDPNRAKLLSVTETDPQFRQAKDVATGLLQGTLIDITNGANHYHTHQVTPAWSKGKAPVFTHGNHKFFKL